MNHLTILPLKMICVIKQIITCIQNHCIAIGIFGVFFILCVTDLPPHPVKLKHLGRERK